MIYNFENFVKKIDENINSSQFLNRFGLTEEDTATDTDAPAEAAPIEPKEDATEKPAEDNKDLEEFKKEHLDVMFTELGSDDFDTFYTSEFKAWKEMEDGEEKDKKKEEILTKIKDMFKLGEEEATDKPEEAPAEDTKAAETAEKPATDEATAEEEK